MDITPDDLFDKRPVPASQPATDADYLGAIERILDKADGFLSKVAIARNMSLNSGSKAGQQAGGGPTLEDIKTALQTVQSVKGDIPISELLDLIAKNGHLIEGVLKK